MIGSAGASKRKMFISAEIPTPTTLPLTRSNEFSRLFGVTQREGRAVFWLSATPPQRRCSGPLGLCYYFISSYSTSCRMFPILSSYNAFLTWGAALVGVQSLGGIWMNLPKESLLGAPGDFHK